MFWILFGLYFISEPQYVEMNDVLNRFNCSDTICESSADKNSVLTKNYIELQKFQILGTDNCSDCGVYLVELNYKIDNGYQDVLLVQINQSEVNSTVHFTSDWLVPRIYKIGIVTTDKIQLFRKPIKYWEQYTAPTPTNSPTNSPTQTFTNSNFFSSSNLFSASNFLIPNRTPLQNIPDTEILDYGQEKSNKTLTIILSTILPCIGIIILIIFLIIIIKRHQKINQKTDSDTSVVFDIQKENDSIKVDQENPLYNQEVDPFLRMMEEEIIN